MKCPVCKDVTLLMSERCGVEIDYCPECRGIWLDRGELEKIMEKEDAYIKKEVKESINKEAKHHLKGYAFVKSFYTWFVMLIRHHYRCPARDSHKPLPVKFRNINITAETSAGLY